eukprot:1261246-Pyramimonas_sp.AAC.1
MRARSVFPRALPYGARSPCELATVDLPTRVSPASMAGNPAGAVAAGAPAVAASATRSICTSVAGA